MLCSCAGEFSPESALLDIQAEPEFNTPYSAPITLSQEVLTDQHHRDLKAFLAAQYGTVMTAGLVTVNIVEKNAWRTVIQPELTDAGRQMVDSQRTQEYRQNGGANPQQTYYVQVCQLVPEQVIDYQQVSEEESDITIQLVERGITPFGTHLGFSDGRAYQITRRFNAGVFGWNLQPLQ